MGANNQIHEVVMVVGMFSLILVDKICQSSPHKHDWLTNRVKIRGFVECRFKNE